MHEAGGSCVQDSSWGYDNRGIWVDRGCRGEFELSDRRGSSVQLTRTGNATGSIAAGTIISVRTNERVESSRSDGRVFSGVVDRDVVDENGIVAIPRGSSAELLVRSPSRSVLVLDLESVTVNGQRYSVSAGSDQVGNERRDGVGANQRTAKFVGGAALLGTILGAVAGGGRGAAIGAAAGAGAGAGAQILTRGKSVRVPSEALLTFRLDQALQIGTTDYGYTRRGRHFH